MGWASKKNGELLALAAAQFDVFLTADRNRSYQQDLSAFDIVVIVMVAPGNRLVDLQPLIPRVLAVLPSAIRGRSTIVGGALSLSEIVALLTLNLGRSLNITFGDGVTQLVVIGSVDDEGFLHSGPDDPDPMAFWTRFEDVTSIDAAGE